MTRQEAIETIRMAIAQVEWEYPMNYAAAFDMAVDALNQQEIVRCKYCNNGFRLDDTNYIVCGRPFACNREAHAEKWFCADGEKME